MEISCDRYALKQLKNDCRAAYAKNLIADLNTRKKTSVFYYNYNKNFIRERIEAIMNYKKLTVGTLVIAMLIPASTVMVFATTDNILMGYEMKKIEVAVLNESYKPVLKEMKSVSLELDWNEIESYVTNANTKAVSYYTVSNYEHITYGKIPPSEIDVLVKKNGYDYTGTLKSGDYKYQSSTNKYTGYYSGKVYR